MNKGKIFGNEILKWYFIHGETIDQCLLGAQFLFLQYPITFDFKL